MNILPPPKLQDLKSGASLFAGLGVSTILPDFDFETYSPAGFVWDERREIYRPPEGANRKGIFAVGAAVYTGHSKAEVLSLAYDLKDGWGKRLWIPNSPLPVDLLNHIKAGGLIEAWNCAFEFWVWTNICVPKYGFPPMSQLQLRCAMAKSRAFALPGGLADAGDVLAITNKKDKEGKRLLDKFSIPRNPSLKDPRHRIKPMEDLVDAQKLYAYNVRDIEAEAEISSLIPDLNPSELEFWQVDQAINFRGVAMDRTAINNCMWIVERAFEKYDNEIKMITNSQVCSSSEVAKIRSWIKTREVNVDSLNADKVEWLLNDYPILSPDVRRVLEIREMMGAVAVSKLYTMKNQLTRKDRMHDMFVYHSARTGRAAGRGVQPQNLPNSGADVRRCADCHKHCQIKMYPGCPWCGSLRPFKIVEWNPSAVEDALETISSRSLECVEYFWGDSIATISGCLRGMFVAAPAHDLICSDYSAIEAVVLAALADEQWRMDVFNTHGKIYEMSASKITGVPFDEFLLHKATSGQHHPLRKKVGKVAELASGFGGWIGAWCNFGADEFFTEREIKDAILAWREASPSIVEFWGGQKKHGCQRFYGLEGVAIQAVMHPGKTFEYRGISYVVRGEKLFCRLLSGRYLTYHNPMLRPSERRPGTLALSFQGWNTNPLQGKIGWVRMDTYGGKLTENVVQATARDILAHAMVQLEKNAYPVVLHVHDEIVSEVPEGYGSVAEFEKIMSTLPDWASGWPVKANGGWRAKRYAK